MGYVGASPNEYLVCTRDGQIDRKRSGQGMRIWKWPWLSVSIIPTTVQRLEFTADQITRERIGVQVSGVAVYRVAEPLIAYRVLTFHDGTLADTLREMFVGAARRVIANLTLDECLMRRKEAIAGFLLEEISPVVGGNGRVEDTTTRGWGIVIDTIEINQVRILSEHVFANLQAPYRAEIGARAEQAQIEAKRETRILAAGAEIAAIEAERSRVEVAHRKQVLERDHAAMLAQREQEAEQARARKQAELALELRRAEAEANERVHELEAAHEKRLAELEQAMAQTRTVRELVTHALPKIAEALRPEYGNVHVTQFGGDGSTGPLAAVPQAIAQLLAIAKSFGLELPVRE